MQPPKKKIKLKDVLIVPLKDKTFMKSITSISVFYFIWYLSMSFATLYQLNYLGLSYTFISISATLNVILQFIWYPVIGKLVDRHNTDFLLIVSYILYLIQAFLWGFTNISSRYVMTILVNIFASMAIPLFSLVVFKAKYDVIPAEDRSLYDGFYTALIALIIAVAPAIGNVLKDSISVNVRPFGIFEVPQFQLIFMLSGILLLGLILLNMKDTVKLFKEARDRKNDNK